MPDYYAYIYSEKRNVAPRKYIFCFKSERILEMGANPMYFCCNRKNSINSTLKTLYIEFAPIPKVSSIFLSAWVRDSSIVNEYSLPSSVYCIRSESECYNKCNFQFYHEFHATLSITNSTKVGHFYTFRH